MYGIGEMIKKKTGGILSGLKLMRVTKMPQKKSIL